MNKLNKISALFAAVALVVPMAASAHNNWIAADGSVWRSASGECWRNAAWTPATAALECDGALKPEPAPAPAPTPAPAPAAAPAAAPAPAPAPKAAPAPAPKAAAPAAPAAVAEKVTFAADAFFDFDKAVLKPEGKAKLKDLVAKTKNISLEVIIAVGHTDSVGTDAYNQKLSERRASAVRAYLIELGVEKNRVYTEGKGEGQPVADNKTAEGRAKNRRVEIEVVGTRTVTK
jgi:OmpA-OmpF porin, OOP family